MTLPSSTYQGRTSEPSLARPAHPRGDSRRRGLAVVAALAGVMWIEEMVDLVGDLGLDRYGIAPRDPGGLVGLLTAPFLHAGFGHLLANTVPFLLLGFLVALGGVVRVVIVTVVVALIGGLGTWLFAPSASIHIGASGVVFGYAGYLLSRGFFTRRLRDFVLAAVIAVVWGGALLGSLLPAAGISWQGHLFGGIGGVLAGRVLAPRASPFGQAANRRVRRF